MRIATLVRRFAIPSFLVTILCWLKFRAFVSARAEVEYGPNLKLGRGSKIGSFTKIKTGHGLISIGANTAVATSCFVGGEKSGVLIGDDCLISPNVVFTAVNYKYDDINTPIHQQGMTSKGIRIGNNVWIGSGCVILDGADIGEGSIISANSTVSGKLAPNSIAQGNPAKLIFQRR